MNYDAKDISCTVTHIDDKSTYLQSTKKQIILTLPTHVVRNRDKAPTSSLLLRNR